MVLYLWAKRGNREFSSKILVSPSTGLEGTSRTLSCRPLIYPEKEEAAEGRTFIAGSILTPAACTIQTADQQPVRAVGSQATL